MDTQNASFGDRHWCHRETTSMRRTFMRHPAYVTSLLARSDISLAMAFVTYILVAEAYSLAFTQKYSVSLPQGQLSSSYSIFYSSKEAAIFSEYKALIPSSISSRMAATSLLGASLPSLTRRPNSRLSSVITTLLVGLAGSSPTLYSIAFIYTFLANAFFLVRALCT